ncbi:MULTISPECIES: hypothetical protein [Streptomyces]|uniref:phage scaffolding protein n=1 Tax=Streptomyces TaxID=1883 RepID=UPI0004CD1B59|nr:MULTISPECIES: hypothetical protein [Streptomyces]
MPEETEPEQDVEEPQEPETAPEADQGTEEEPFDAERAKKALSKKNAEAKSLRERLKELEPLARKAKELEDAQKSEAERLNEQLAEAQDRIRTVQQRAVRSEVRALAASNFADPDDAHAFLDLDSFVDTDGEIDTDGISRSLADLLKRKPHLAKPSAEGPRSPRPDRTQGSSGNGNRPSLKPEDEFAGWLTKALNGGR